MKSQYQVTLSLAGTVSGMILAACAGGDASGPPTPTRRDSAGVSIVEYPSLQTFTTELRIEPTPFREVGGSTDNPADELDPRHPYFTATALSDGRVVVNDYHRLVFFDNRDSVIFTRGRSGKGPGEFGQLFSVCRLPGDSLLAFSSGRDPQLFNPAGNFVRAYPRARNPASDGCFDDGSIVAALSRDNLPEGALANQPLAEDEGYFVRIRPNGEKLSDIGRLPTSSYKTDILREVSIVPFHDRLYVADAKTFEIREHSPDGKVLRILRVAFEPKAVPPDAQPDFAVAAGSPAPATVRPPSMPATYPVYGRVRVDAGGRVWIQDYDARNKWTVFDSDFALLGRVTMRAVPNEEPDHLVGFEQDHIVILRFDREGAPVLSFHRFGARR